MGNDSPAGVFRPLIGAVAMLASHVIAGLVALAVLSRVVPIYMKLYLSWENELPQMTQWLLGSSRFLAHYGCPLCLAFLVLDGTILAALARLPQPRRWLRACWHTAVLLAVVLYLGFVMLALAMPLVTGPIQLSG